MAILLYPLLGGCVADWQLADVHSGLARRREPSTMVLMLSPSRLEQNGQPAQPGMFCRAYFFDGAHPIPIEADGDVAFTACRAQGDGPPDGQYQIARQRLRSHLRPDVVGPSYLFWLPADSLAQGSVRVQGQFRSPTGQTIASSIVTVNPSTDPH